MTAMPSLATWTSLKVTPFFSQSAFSSSLIGRDASEISVSPAQKRTKPSPVPAPPTVIFTPGCDSPKNSDAASANGWTVEEPSMATLPLSSSWEASPPPRRLRTGARVIVAARGDTCTERAAERERLPPGDVPSLACPPHRFNLRSR